MMKPFIVKLKSMDIKKRSIIILILMSPMIMIMITKGMITTVDTAMEKIST